MNEGHLKMERPGFMSKFYFFLKNYNNNIFNFKKILLKYLINALD